MNPDRIGVVLIMRLLKQHEKQNNLDQFKHTSWQMKENISILVWPYLLVRQSVGDDVTERNVSAWPKELEWKKKLDKKKYIIHLLSASYTRSFLTEHMHKLLTSEMLTWKAAEGHVWRQCLEAQESVWKKVWYQKAKNFFSLVDKSVKFQPGCKSLEVW